MYIGDAGNNVAEYHGLRIAMQRAVRRPDRGVVFKVDSDLLFEQAGWSIALYLMNVVVISTICTITFHLKHLVPDPYDKMGHQWANPEVHRKAVSAKARK